LTKAKPEGTRPVSELVPYVGNARRHSEEQISQIEASMLQFGWTIPCLIDEAGVLIAGHGRVEAAERIYGAGKMIRGLDGNWLPEGHAPILVAKGWSEAKKRAYVIADNSIALNASWDEVVLRSEIEALGAEDFDLSTLGFDEIELGAILGDPAGPDGDDDGDQPGKAGSLVERFGVAPFSVLNAREGWWQDRKRAWLALGIQSEVGRGDDQLGFSETIKSTFSGNNPQKRQSASLKGGLTVATSTDPYRKPGESVNAAGAGTSIFDPVLCELAYRWFCPAEGAILDPFAGGSVRGIVAAKLGRRYTGIDLRPEQVEANRAQGAAICDGIGPAWICGDSLEVLDGHDALPAEADFIFSCPPYADLEVYSDDPRDISNMDYRAFASAYGGIIAKACARLKEHRFACFVVGEVRDQKGIYRNFVGDTVEAFRAAGLKFYNEAILVTSAGSLPLRAGKQFSATRKLGKTHQNVLLFVKGDPRKATLACGDVEFGEIEASAELDDAA
jgi:ParB-like chromosome segregation protein Spo0J